LNPRQDWLAVRLARKYQASGDWENSTRVLDACLRENPSSKLAHLEIGRVLLASGDSGRAIEHLRRGFTQGDNNYEAQFWFARELFLQGHFPEAEKLFSTLN
jgi:Flp pilus assembly protein TadD